MLFFIEKFYLASEVIYSIIGFNRGEEEKMPNYNSISEARQHHLKVKSRIREITKCDLGDPAEMEKKDGVWESTVKVVSNFKTKIELKKLKKELNESETYLVSAKTAAIDKEQFEDTFCPEDDDLD